MRYLVTFKEVRWTTYEVEAADDDDADMIAEGYYNEDDPDHEFDRDIEVVGSTVVPWPNGDDIPAEYTGRIVP